MRLLCYSCSSGGDHQPKYKECKHVTDKRLRFRREGKPLAPYATGRELLSLVGDGKVLLMIGDSVLHQQFGAIECAARRDGCKKVAARSIGVYLNDLKPFKALGPEYAPCDNWRVGIRREEVVELECPRDQSDETFRVKMVFLLQYRPCMLNQINKPNDRTSGSGEYAPHEQAFISKYDPDVLVYPGVNQHVFPQDNTGASGDAGFRTMDKGFVENEFLSVLQSKVLTEHMAKPASVLILIEPTATHFNTDGGYFLPMEGTYNAGERHLTVAQFEHLGGKRGFYPTWFSGKNGVTPNWGGDVLRSVARRGLNISGFHHERHTALAAEGPTPRVALIPQFELSRSRPDIHLMPVWNDSRSHDATHHCYSALYLEPLIDSFVMALRDVHPQR